MHIKLRRNINSTGVVYIVHLKVCYFYLVHLYIYIHITLIYIYIQQCEFWKIQFAINLNGIKFTNIHITILIYTDDVSNRKITCFNKCELIENTSVFFILIFSEYRLLGYLESIIIMYVVFLVIENQSTVISQRSS